MLVTLPNSEAPIEMDIDLSHFKMEVENDKYWEEIKTAYLADPI
jgi:hypothetical protein